MSEKAIVADISPVQVEFETGKQVVFCTCGRSSNQPHCDGSHRGTGLAPKPHTPEAAGPAWLCRCKATANAPFCDGSHKRFSEADIGKPQGD